MENSNEILAMVIPIVASAGGFLWWHFSEINKLKEPLNQLEKEVERLKSKDELQQQTIDQLKELYPLLHQAMEILNDKKK